LWRLDVPTVLIRVVLNVHDVRVRGGETGVHLKLLPKLVGCHVSVHRAANPTAAATRVIPIMPIEAAAFSRLTIPPLHLLIDKVLKVLLSDLRLRVLGLVSDDVFL